MKNLVWILVFVSVIMSCSEHATNNVQTIDGEYLPIKQGNYWVFDTWMINENNQEITGTRAIDSLYVSNYGINIFENDNTNQAIVLRFRDNQLIDTIHFKIKDNFVYSEGLFVDSIIRDDSRAYRFIDKNLSTQWNICSYYFDFSILYSGYIMPCQLATIYNGYTDKSETINVNGVDLKMEMLKIRKDNVYSMYHKFDTSKTMKILIRDTVNGVPTETFKDTIVFYADTCYINLFKPKIVYIGLIKDIGFGKILENPFTVTSTKDVDLPQIKNEYYKVNGRVCILKRYKIENK